MLKARDVINQCYILQERLYEDAFCERWRATALYSATQFLLRIFKDKPGLEEAFKDFRSLALQTYPVSNPAILDFVEIERFEGRNFIVSEYAGQRPLASLPSDEARFPLEHIVRFVIELAQGLDAFHAHGIVYRFLDAESVLVASKGGRLESIQIQKPGYAPLLGLLDLRDPPKHSALGFVAPEARKEGGDARSDIYSLGIHLVRFITGRLPYPPGADLAGGASASLRYVANALRRRGIPESLVAHTLKALRKTPRQRQASCIEFITGLREFVEERRRELLQSGKTDPLAELEALNRGGARLGATEAVRTLDTAAYFRALSEAPEEPPPPRPVLLFPPRNLPDSENTERLELDELSAPADDAALSLADYLGKTPAVLYAEEEEKPLAPAAPAEVPAEAAQTAEERLDAKPAYGKESPATGSGHPSSASPSASGLPPGSPDGGAAQESEPRRRAGLVAPAEAPEPTIEELASDRAPGRRRAKSAALLSVGIEWRRETAPSAAVIEGMESAFTRAFRGRGAFRFIEEPRSGRAAQLLTKALGRFREEGLVVDLGSLGKAADSTDLLRALRAALGRALTGEKAASLRLLAKRSREADAFGAFAAPPLGNLLFGQDAEEPDPEIVEAAENAAALAKALAAFGRRRKPLVLVLRGGQELGVSAHGVIIELARIVSGLPVCGFVFYGKGKTPAWHVLATSRLDEGS